MPPDVGVLVPAAGRGERAGGAGREAKQFRPVGGIPLLLRAIRPFAQHPRVHQIVVALPTDATAQPPGWLAGVAGGGGRLQLVAGGATRSASVRAALEALGPACTIVLVHDAARPFVDTADIDAVIAAVERGTGAIPAVPVADTLKRADADGTIVQTLPRDGLWRAQTPQGFPRAMLEAAYRAAGDEAPTATDDAALVEAAGGTVIVVPGRAENIKLTTPDDFRLAELLAAR